jgi:hypothetical protein
MASADEVEAKELALVGKVEMRIALTDSEKKLEDLLKVYLAPLLLKLGSDYVAVRNKVNQSTRFPLGPPSIEMACSLLQTPLTAVLHSGHFNLSAHQYPDQVTVCSHSLTCWQP